MCYWWVYNLYRIVPSRFTWHNSAIQLLGMSGRKRSSCFAITLNHVDFDKTCLAEYWMSDNLIKRIAIGEEVYHAPLNPITGELDDINDNERHHHIFVEFNDKYFLTEVRDLVIDFLGGDDTRSIDVQCCKSPKAWLIYLSKEDYCPYLFGVRVSELSLYARAKHHAKATYKYIRPIDKADPFIVGSGQNARFVISVIEEHIEALRYKERLSRRILEPNRRCSISNEVLQSVQHLYIEGPPGYGKTELIDFFVKGKKVWKAGEPSSFLFGTLTEEVEVIWFEDFDMNKFHVHLSTLLSLMDHKPVTISKKGVDDRTILFKGQIIFSSNFPIGNYEMFKRRIKHIEVLHKLYECLGCIGDFIPANQINFSITGDDLFSDLEENENNLQVIDGLENIMTPEEIEQFFESM